MELKKNVLKRMKLILDDPYLSASDNPAVIKQRESLKKEIEALKNISQDDYKKWGGYAYWELVRELTNKK